jgi:hypothetical protein
MIATAAVLDMVHGGVHGILLRECLAYVLFVSDAAYNSSVTFRTSRIAKSSLPRASAARSRDL